MEPPINTMNNNSTSPYISTPYNFYYSAPTSPLHISASSSIIAFEEEDEEEEEGYEFEFSGQLDTLSRSSLSTADELFDGGKIRPLKPPSQTSNGSNTSQNKKADQFSNQEEENPLKFNDNNRGRSKKISTLRSNSRKGISRSLSPPPLRVSEFALLQEQEQQQEEDMKKLSRNSIKSNNGGSLSFRWGSNKWRLKDLLLFRSASEGRANTRGKDPLRKYFSIVTSKNNNDEEFKSSFRSSIVDGSVSRRRGKGSVSAHEMHYMENRAVSGELKKKTSLPYKHGLGLLGCLGLNPVFHGIFAPS